MNRFVRDLVVLVALALLYLLFIGNVVWLRAGPVIAPFGPIATLRLRAAFFAIAAVAYAGWALWHLRNRRWVAVAFCTVVAPLLAYASVLAVR